MSTTLYCMEPQHYQSVDNIASLRMLCAFWGGCRYGHGDISPGGGCSPVLRNKTIDRLVMMWKRRETRLRGGINKGNKGRREEQR